MQVTKKTAANFLKISPPTLYAWIKAGHLQEPLTTEQLYAFAEKYHKWYHCRKCCFEWATKKPKEVAPTMCPKCRNRHIEEGLKPHWVSESITISAAARTAGKSPATILNWIEKGYLTNAGSGWTKAVFAAELREFLASRRVYSCLACGYSWTRFAPGRQARCSYCGSSRIESKPGGGHNAEHP